MTPPILSRVMGVCLPLCLVLILLSSNGCEEDIGETDPPNLIASPIHYPVALSFMDANPAADRANIRNVQVIIYDPQGQVLTAGGSEADTIDATFGLISLGLSRSFTLEEGQSYSFRIRASAPEYTEIVRTIRISGESPGYFPILMSNLKSPPPGISASTQAANISTAGVVLEPIVINAENKSGGFGDYVLSIPEGTKLLYNDEPVEVGNDPLTIKASFGDPARIEANRVFPNGFFVDNAIDMNGEQIPPFYFKSAGWATIEMRAGDQPINGFSDSVSLLMPINPDLVNPTSENNYEIGDEAPIWSLDNETGQWKEEFKTTVVQTQDGLGFSFNITHLSTWNVDYKGTTCPGDLIIQYENDACPAYLYSELRIGNVPFSLTPAGESQSNVLPYLNNVGQFSIMNAPADDTNLNFVVYDNQTGIGSPAFCMEIGTSCASGDDCSSPDGDDRIDISPGSVNCDLTTFQFRFVGSSTDVPCNVAVWSKHIPDVYDPSDPGSGDLAVSTWTYIGTIGSEGMLAVPNRQLLDGASDNNFRILLWWGFDLAELPDNTNSLRFTVREEFSNYSNCPIPLSGDDNTLTLPSGGTNVTVGGRCFGSSSTDCIFSSAAGSYDCTCFDGSYDDERGIIISIGGGIGNRIPSCPLGSSSSDCPSL